MVVLIEMIEAFTFCDLRVRIWSEYTLPSERDLKDLYMETYNTRTFMTQVLNEWKANAIEVLDSKGTGFVAYADWP